MRSITITIILVLPLLFLFLLLIVIMLLLIIVTIIIIIIIIITIILIILLPLIIAFLLHHHQPHLKSVSFAQAGRWPWCCPGLRTGPGHARCSRHPGPGPSRRDPKHTRCAGDLQCWLSGQPYYWCHDVWYPKDLQIVVFLTRLPYMCRDIHIRMCTTYVYIPTYLLTYLHTYIHKRFPCFGSKKFLPFQAKKKTTGSVKTLDLQISIYPLVPSTPGLGGEFMGWLRSTTMEQQPQQFQHLGVGGL